MSDSDHSIHNLGITGCGAMGRGIAQVAALAGFDVRLFDANPAAVEAAQSALKDIFSMLVKKGKLKSEEADQARNRIKGEDSLLALADCDLVIEAIIENLDAKQQLFAELENIVSPSCLLASNTSSFAITAIAAGCRQPERVFGLHFFNPVPLMKVVEVIDGVKSDRILGDHLQDFVGQLGHAAVRVKDMPGFLVNHAGRAMNTEGLRIVSEQVASIYDVDRVMREQAGFRLGPFELMDLTGLDVSHPVMESIYHQFYEEPRFTPSPLTRVRMQAGLMGRKSGEGFYRYHDGQIIRPEEQPTPVILPSSVWISPQDHERRAAVVRLLDKTGVSLDEGEIPLDSSLIIVTPLGHDATTSALQQGLDARRTVAIDTLHDFSYCQRITLMSTPKTEREFIDAAQALFVSTGLAVSVIKDSTGFIAQRMIAMIVNIACDIAQRGIAQPEDIEKAVTAGLGYPVGPLTLGDQIGSLTILDVTRHIYELTGDPRYRPSLWLSRRARLGLSLLFLS